MYINDDDDGYVFHTPAGVDNQFMININQPIRTISQQFSIGVTGKINEIWINLHNFQFNEMHLKMSSAKFLLFLSTYSNTYMR